MKTQKNFAWVAIIAIITIALFACDNGDNKKDPVPCACETKAHLGIDETCTCGGEDCDCTLQNYNPGNLAFGAIPIYKDKAITTTGEGEANELATIIGIINTRYEGLNTDEDRAKFDDVVKEIHIKAFVKVNEEDKPSASFDKVKGIFSVENGMTSGEIRNTIRDEVLTAE